ncbi:hypothetical protein FJN17_08030 [Bradyrhizobium symbiodeficiens]|uniref:Uncharacterized protein n=1 Tax=Bradyrhizobium symbiodeficiens TaxID=1404367 RepID=A0ABX5W4H0_9BRAD|nr:hypothetical protein [Bradyrhizobium symbiodeficiens]QDF37517.1 hypothetical protein FJN17_08030 [Bradyrhizobium symbiodeficiens]
MNTIATAPSKYGWTVECLDVSKLLGNITDEIKAFEAKQLGKLKGELEAFDKKKHAVSDAYGQKYAALVQRWCNVTSDMEVLHRTLVCLFGKDAWKGYVTECVCPKLSEVADADAALQVRLSCALGELEKARNQAIATTDQAKLYLDTLTGNQAALEKDLKANEDWIAEIKRLLQGRDAAKAIYLFWFKVLPKQLSMANTELAKKLDFAKDELPGALCPPKSGSATQQTGADRSGAAAGMAPHPVPWLVDPKQFAKEIDCAWSAYWDAKKKQGEAEVRFNNAPDDVASTEKKLEELRKALDATIGDCLAKAAPSKCDCAEPAAGREAAAPQPDQAV